MKITLFIMMVKIMLVNDINKIDQIIKGEDIIQEKFFSKKFCFNKFFNG